MAHGDKFYSLNFLKINTFYDICHILTVKHNKIKSAYDNLSE